jgi:hypothetical protein
MTYSVLLSILIQIALIVHVLRTGRNTVWILVLLFVPILGSLAYVVVEILPGAFHSYGGRRALAGARRAVDPNRDLRTASDHAAVVDTVGAKTRLGEELFRRGRYAEAIDTYRSALKGMYEHDPNLLLGLARAQFESGDAAGALATFQTLREHNPTFRSDAGFLLFARALEAVGDLPRAEQEYRAVAGYYAGPEAKVRYAQLLRRLAQPDRARELLEDVVNTADLAPRHVRRFQGEWLRLARRELAELAAASRS